MKQINIDLNEFENPQTKESDIIISELQNVKYYLKELALREKIIKQELEKRIETEPYESDKYKVEFKEIITKRLDIDKIKEALGDKVATFQKESISKRLNIKLKH